MEPLARRRAGVPSALILALLLAARSAAAPPPTLEAFDVGGLEARSAALLLSGEEGGELPVSVLALPLAPQATRSGGIGVVVDVDGAALLAEATDAGGTGRTAPEEVVTELHVYALDPDGGLAGFLDRAAVLDGAAARSAGEAWAGLKLLARLPLEAGRYTVRVLVLRRATGRFALREEAVTVPEPGALGAIPPGFAEDPAPWTVVRGPEGAGGALPGDWPERLPVPATRPVVVRGGERSLHLVGVDAGALKARLVGPGGREAGRPELVVASDRPGGAGVETRLGGLEVPPGEYRLELSSSGEALPSIPLVVAPRGTAVLAWPLLRRGVSTSGRAVTVAAPTGEAGRDLTIMRRALEHLAEGRQAAAAAVLEGLEGSPRSAERAGEALARSELEAAARLVHGEAQALLPLARLYGTLYAERLGRRDYRLATHARRMAESLLALYAREARGGERVVADALAGLASRLLEVGDTLKARDLLAAALDHRPDHGGALLVLSAIEEQLGRHQEAVRLLQRRGGTDGTAFEARLRLGVNLLRLGKVRRGARLLEALARDDRAPRWVRVVALETLAARELAAGAHGTAIARLRHAVEAYPEQQRFHIQLAAALDGAGRSAEARKVLAVLDQRLLAGVGREGPSPRLRYARLPEDVLAPARASFAEAAAAGVPILAAALGRDGEPGRGR